MKYFNRNGKFNFVDDNNVFVGYDSDQQCCEYFDAKLSLESGQEIDLDTQGDVFDGYQFDISFFEEGEGTDDYEYFYSVKFKLTKEGSPDLFLELSNSHNGYYSHGFEAKVGGEVWKEGCL